MRSDASVSVSFDPVEVSGSDLIVRVHVHGAHALGAALLRLEYPADQWRARFREPCCFPGAQRVGWYPIVEYNS